MKTVALITLHGMGERDSGYYVGLHDRLARKLDAAWANVSFQAIDYASILQGPQDALWSAVQAEPSNNLDFVKLRRFFLFGFGDAGSLEHSAHRDPANYRAVQCEIQRALDVAFSEMGGNPQAPCHHRRAIARLPGHLELPLGRAARQIRL